MDLHINYFIRMQCIKNNFRTIEKRFSSKDESIILHSETLNSSYYTGAEVYKDNPYEYLKAIAPIYATDTEYYDNGETIINKYMYWNKKNEQKP